MELSLNTQSELNYNIPVLFKCPGNENNINTDKKAN
ncbi:MAG: hypothetical protein K0S55_1807, partial [Clostridia bacterium]|nr:hypothetical protein [Clostridia bacterium]